MPMSFHGDIVRRLTSRQAGWWLLALVVVIAAGLALSAWSRPQKRTGYPWKRLRAPASEPVNAQPMTARALDRG